jgi:hypothetical protein
VGTLNPAAFDRLIDTVIRLLRPPTP